MQFLHYFSIKLNVEFFNLPIFLLIKLMSHMKNKIALFLAFVCSILSVEAQKVKLVDSLRLIYEKYRPADMTMKFEEGHSPNAIAALKIKNLAEFEELMKKEVQIRERRRITIDSLKRHPSKNSWVL